MIEYKINRSTRGIKTKNDMKKLDLKKLAMSLTMMFVISFSVVLVSCSHTADVTVTKSYQPLVSGMVHTWIQVRFEDNSTAEVVLPDDDAVWSKGRNAARNSGKAKVKKSGDKWVFVSFE
jgi:hypothetical protein